MENYCKCGRENKFLLRYEPVMRTNMEINGLHTCREHFGDKIKKSILKTKQKRYSGYSKYQDQTGGFQQSSHA